MAENQKCRITKKYVDFWESLNDRKSKKPNYKIYLRPNHWKVETDIQQLRTFLGHFIDIHMAGSLKHQISKKKPNNKWSEIKKTELLKSMYIFGKVYSWHRLSMDEIQDAEGCRISKKPNNQWSKIRKKPNYQIVSTVKSLKGQNSETK